MSNNDLTLEKLKIDERLRKVELELAEAKPIREQILEKLEKIDKSVEKLDHKINGNGVPGIDDRLKAIEAAEEGRKESYKTIIKIATGAITALIITIAAWLGKAVLALIRMMGS